jgi:hypothetical protein
MEHVKDTAKHITGALPYHDFQTRMAIQVTDRGGVS